jgi:hypothetical protein
VARPLDETTAEIAEPLTKQDFEALARFRFGIRRYLRFSEETVRRHGATPQQYQLLLAIKGFPGRDWAVVRRTTDPDDARAVRVVLTDEGEHLLDRLSALHRDELRRMDSVLALPQWQTAE